VTVRELRHVEDLRALDIFIPTTGGNGAISAICALFLARLDETWLPAARWVRAMEVLGFPASTARSNLRRMTKAGYLIREPRGGLAGYSMSAALRSLVGDQREADYSDERWLLVTVRVPETRRDVRSQLRTLLARGGFGALGNGVWLGRPHHASRALEFATVLGMTDYLDVFIAEHIGPHQLASMVARCWDLPAIVAAYDELLAELKSVPSRLSPEAAFARVVEVMQRWRGLLELDPGLPDSALPRTWPGARARAALQAFQDKHMAAGEGWLLSVE
jgi:phenylacetic acid degradation operon negative regulatory protein